MSTMVAHRRSSVFPDRLAVRVGSMTNALFQAVARGSCHNVKYYLDKGVKVRGLNDLGESVLQTALYIEDPERRDRMFRYLVRRGADCLHVDKNTGRDVIQLATLFGRTRQVERLIDYTLGEIDLMRGDLAGQTALHHAVIQGHRDIVQLLVSELRKYRLNVDVADKYGLTPYMYARRLGHAHIAQMLLRDGNASPFRCDDDFRSAEHWALVGQRERRQEAHCEALRMDETRKIQGRLPALKGHDDIESIQRPGHQTLINSSLSNDSARNSDGKTQAASPTTEEEKKREEEDQLKATLALLGIAGMQKYPLSHARTFVESEFDTSKAREYGGIMDGLVDLMEMLTYQKCHSYRAPAKPRFGSRGSLGRMSDHDSSKSKVSTLAILFGKDKKAAARGRHQWSSTPPRRVSPAKHHRKALGSSTAKK